MLWYRQPWFTLGSLPIRRSVRQGTRRVSSRVRGERKLGLLLGSSEETRQAKSEIMHALPKTDAPCQHSNLSLCLCDAV